MIQQSTELLLLNISYLPWVPGRKKRNEAIFFYLLKETGLFSRGLFVNPIEIQSKPGERELFSGMAGKTQFYVSQIVISGSLYNEGLSNNYQLAAASYAEILQEKYIANRPYILWMNTAERFEYSLACHLLPRAKQAIFDLSDDFTTFLHNDPEIFKEHLKILINASDGLLCVNKHVQTKFVHKRSFVLNNGTDFDNFQQIYTNFTLPPLFPKLPNKKYIGFSGGIFEKRMDMGILRKLFNTFPECIFIFVGYYNNREFIRQLVKYDHVHYIPEVPYSLLPNIINKFDVAIIPHLLHDGTDGNDLLKLYDYLACGVPVVSTDCSDLRRFNELIHVSTDGDQFCENVASIINGKLSVNVSTAKEYAKSCSWENRISLLHRWLKDEVMKTNPGS